jgi:Kef-type K+ transport system membrane component KefB
MLGQTHFGMLLLLGIAVIGGILSALFVRRLNIPQVLGYLLVGVLIGESGLKLVHLSDIASLRSLNYFALGIIGFLVGSEIRFATMKKYGRQFSAIMLGEGLGAFFLVAVPSGLIVFLLFGNLAAALAAAVVLGAIASATDPASTIDVLQEYRTAGILTTTVIAIVALDDALAMTLYGLGTSAARILTGQHVSMGSQVWRVTVELFGSVALGVSAGYLLDLVLHRARRSEYMLAFAIGILLLAIGAAQMMDMDVILATMSMGLVVGNAAPRRSEALIRLLRSASFPIYVLFFVLVGARLGISSMPSWLWLLVAVYVVGRTVGKMAGSFFGALVSRADPVVRRYYGMALFAQGGVAVGLSIMASQHLQDITLEGTLSLGDAIIFCITATTFVVQILGPPLVKLAVSRAGEIGRRVSEEDVVARWKVRDAMDEGMDVVRENTPIRMLFSLIPEGGYMFFPVTGEDGSVVGLVTFEQMREVVLHSSSWDWLVVSDLMVPLRDWLYSNAPLEDALATMRQLGTEQMLVLEDREHRIPAGILDLRTVNRRIRRQLLELRPETEPAGLSSG